MSRTIKDETDYKDKLDLKSYLERQGHKVIIPLDPSCCFDVESIKKGTHYIYEIKHRRVESTLYGDVIIENKKLKKLKETGKPFYIINIFTDNVIYIADNNTKYEIQNRFCRATTNWNQNKINKELVSYKIEDCIKLSFDDYYGLEIVPRT